VTIKLSRSSKNAEFRSQNALLLAVLESMPQGIAVFDQQLHLQVCNQGFFEALHLPPDDAVDGTRLSDLTRLVSQQQGQWINQSAEQFHRLEAAAQDFIAFSCELIQSSGRVYRVNGRPLVMDGQLAGYVITYADISERRAIQEREQLAQTVFAHTPGGIIVTDDAQRIISANPATSLMSGYSTEEIVGQTIFSLVAADSSLTPTAFEQAIKESGTWNGEINIMRKTGESLAAEIRVNRIDDLNASQSSHYIWILADITERKVAEARMRHIAQSDSLTGLPNRLALQLRLALTLPEARRHEWQVAIMFIDLDRFKNINDTLGHPVGDELLREVASRLSLVVRETDFVARLGGDEFVIVLPAITNPADAATVANKIIGALSSPIVADGHELHTSPSIGISIFPDDGSDGDTVLKNADTAMYHAKSAGRNNYQFYAGEMNKTASERLDIERKLRHAISRNELSLCYQPQFSAVGSQPTGVEALVRWHHPTDGMISPMRFIPIAEETGLIVEIGEWVLRTACHEMRNWIEAGLEPIRVAVNISARQLRRRDFCEVVAGCLAESGLPSELLELEITESAVMENPKEAISILESIGRMGVTLAIDDFGTGYSSLAYLKLFPIDHLKIDRSFVADIEFDLNDRAIAFGTIALAHSLGLNVIAEGVETEDQLDLLRSNGCDEVQGYLFSKPLTSSAAFAFLHARATAG
jgi:diguanylate cyclase (GGDEF)-like protein/PAS domain S-box-containing protein